jgi:hypothetical protein
VVASPEGPTYRRTSSIRGSGARAKERSRRGKRKNYNSLIGRAARLERTRLGATAAEPSREPWPVCQCARKRPRRHDPQAPDACAAVTANPMPRAMGPQSPKAPRERRQHNTHHAPRCSLSFALGWPGDGHRSSSCLSRGRKRCARLSTSGASLPGRNPDSSIIILISYAPPRP